MTLNVDDGEPIKRLLRIIALDGVIYTLIPRDDIFFFSVSTKEVSASSESFLSSLSSFYISKTSFITGERNSIDFSEMISVGISVLSPVFSP